MKKTKLANGFWRFEDGNNVCVVERESSRGGEAIYNAYTQDGSELLAREWGGTYLRAAKRALHKLTTREADRQLVNLALYEARMASRTPEFRSEEGFRILAKGIPSYRVSQICTFFSGPVDFRGCDKTLLQRCWEGSGETYPSNSIDRFWCAAGLLAEAERKGAYHLVYARLRSLSANFIEQRRRKWVAKEGRQQAKAFQARLAAAVG